MGLSNWEPNEIGVEMKEQRIKHMGSELGGSLLQKKETREELGIAFRLVLEKGLPSIYSKCV